MSLATDSISSSDIRVGVGFAQLSRRFKEIARFGRDPVLVDKKGTNGVPEQRGNAARRLNAEFQERREHAARKHQRMRPDVR